MSEISAKVTGLTISSVNRKGEELANYTVCFEDGCLWIKSGSESMIIEAAAWPLISNAADDLLRAANTSPGGSDDNKK